VPREANEDGIHEVKSRHAHAWAEIYLEGYGWGRFDPTPAADAPGRYSLLPTAENFPLTDYGTGEVITVGLTGMFLANFSDTEIEYREIAENTINVGSVSDLAMLAMEIEYGILNYELLNIITVNLIIAASAVLFAFILYVLIRWFIFRTALKRISDKTNNEATLKYYEIILKYLNFFNYKRNPHETIIQFAARIDDEINGMNAIAGTLSKALYGYRQISLNEIDDVRRMIGDLDKKILSSVGRVRYIIYHINFSLRFRLK